MAKKRTRMRQESFKKSIRLTGTIVSSVAQRRQKQRHIHHQPTKMPLSEDLTTLKEWLCGEMIEGIHSDHPARMAWERTAQITLVRIALFKKRRIGEVPELKVSDFIQIHQTDKVDREIYNSLDVSERILSKR
ncbi:hypothetical protein DPMN_089099 [Dreissena polymorpha]|uniref:Uncharacterized protein n=1 Tax=Dreissena polymorpha TaxID=45954 RepID=A0A9D4KX49_DREPO|nr:hypothetical protein DPMN_089099 [Dreissena polymorpha]